MIATTAEPLKHEPYQLPIFDPLNYRHREALFATSKHSCVDFTLSVSDSAVLALADTHCCSPKCDVCKPNALPEGRGDLLTRNDDVSRKAIMKCMASLTIRCRLRCCVACDTVSLPIRYRFACVRDPNPPFVCRFHHSAGCRLQDDPRSHSHEGESMRASPS